MDIKDNLYQSLLGMYVSAKINDRGFYDLFNDEFTRHFDGLQLDIDDELRCLDNIRQSLMFYFLYPDKSRCFDDAVKRFQELYLQSPSNASH